MPLTSDPDCTLLVMIGGDAPERVMRAGSRVRISGATDITKLLLHADGFDMVDDRPHLRWELYRIVCEAA